MKKQILTAMLAAAMGFSFLGCSSSAADSTADNTATSTVSESSVSETEESPIVIQATNVTTSAGDEFTVPDDGKEFLIVTVDIKNNGDDDVDANPVNFKLLADGVEYDSSFYSLENVNDLQTVTLKNGGETSGDLIFEVPANTTSGTLEFFSDIFSSDPSVTVDINA